MENPDSSAAQLHKNLLGYAPNTDRQEPKYYTGSAAASDHSSEVTFLSIAQLHEDSADDVEDDSIGSIIRRPGLKLESRPSTDVVSALSSDETYPLLSEPQKRHEAGDGQLHTTDSASSTPDPLISSEPAEFRSAMPQKKVRSRKSGNGEITTPTKIPMPKYHSPLAAPRCKVQPPHREDISPDFSPETSPKPALSNPLRKFPVSPFQLDPHKKPISSKRLGPPTRKFTRSRIPSLAGPFERAKGPTKTTTAKASSRRETTPTKIPSPANKTPTKDATKKPLDEVIAFEMDTSASLFREERRCAPPLTPQPERPRNPTPKTASEGRY